MITCLQDVWEGFWAIILRGLNWSTESLGKRLRIEYIAYFFAILSTLINTMSAVIQKYYKYDFAVITLARGMIIAIIFYTTTTVSQKTVNVYNKGDFRRLIFRIFNAAANLLSFSYLYTKLPLSEISMIINTNPIVIFLMNYYFFNEKINSNIWIGFLSSFLGLFVILSNNTTGAAPMFNYAQGTERYLCFGLAMFNVFSLAYSIVLIRFMTPKMDNNQNSFAVGIGTVLLSGILIIQRDTTSFFQRIQLVDFFRLLFVGFLGTLMQALFFGAQFFARHKSGQLTLINYLGVIWAFAVEVIIFDEPIQMVVVGGAVLILIGLWFIMKDQIIGPAPTPVPPPPPPQKESIKEQSEESN